MAQIPPEQPLSVVPGYNASVASGNQNPRSPTSIRSAARRQFIALNPDPASSSSPSSAEHGSGGVIRPAEGYLPDPRANINIAPPPDIRSPHNAFSPAPTVMNVDPAAPVLGVAGEEDVRAQQAMEEAERDRKANEMTVTDLARKATISKGKKFIGGFVPWLKGLGGPRPEHPPKHEMVGPHAGMVPMPTADTRSAHSQTRSERSQPSSFQPLPPIRIESPSSQNTTPFIPPPPSIHSEHTPPPLPPPARGPSPTLEGTTLLGHGLTLSAAVPLRPTSTQYVDPATLALPDSPEYQPLPHAADYAKMEANPEKSESKAASFAAKSPTFARLHNLLKKIDELPWIGYERITADYYPSRVDAEGKPWRFGSYEKRRPPPPFSPTHPHGGRLPNEELMSPTFGYHRASRYDFGIRRSQFSRLKVGKSKSRSALNSWYDGKSQKSNKELDLLSSGDEVDPFPSALPPLQTAMMVGHTPVSMAPVPLYEQRIVDGKPVDVDVDRERGLYQDPDHAEGAELGRRAVLAQNGYEVPINQTASHAAASVLSHAHTASVRSPTSTIRSPPMAHQPSSHSRSRSHDPDSQLHVVYSTRTPKYPKQGHGYPASSHSKSYSVDYYTQSATREFVPPAPVSASVVSTRTGSIRVGEPKKPKNRTHSRSRSTPQPTMPAPVYYSTRTPSQDGHHRSISRGEGSRRRDERSAHAMPVPI